MKTHESASLRHWKRLLLLLVSSGLLAAASLRAQQTAQLGPAPTAPKRVARTQPSAVAPGSGTNAALSVDLSTRRQSLAFYQSVYLPSQNMSSGWTGNLAQGTAGATSQAFRDAVALRINYFRAMAGVPAAVTLSDAYNAEDQQAALMMSTNGQNSHNPSASWLNYTDAGADAAAHSNLFLGLNGPAAIDGYMQDAGDNNGFVGHRRWVLCPQTLTMGSGDVEGTTYSLLNAPANALWVIDDNYYNARPATRDGFVAWPPPGFVPYPLISARWSFSLPDVDFSQARVSMTKDGAALTVTQATLVDGYAENTLVWTPQDVTLTADNPSSSVPVEQQEPTFQITVSNVLVNGTATSFSYAVRTFDPAQAGADPSPAVFAGEKALGSGVYYLQFPNGNLFGYYAYLSDPRYVYHFDLGYEYVLDAKDAQGGLYLYDFGSGDWLYTSPRFSFPYLYDFRLAAMLYYYPQEGKPGSYTSAPRYFFDFASGQIVTL